MTIREVKIYVRQAGKEKKPMAGQKEAFIGKRKDLPRSDVTKRDVRDYSGEAPKPERSCGKRRQKAKPAGKRESFNQDGWKGKVSAANSYS